MKISNVDSQIETIAQPSLDRRNFFRKAGYFGLGAAVSGMALAAKPAAAQASAQSQDTTAELFTAFLIAEDLATTFYYNGLVGGMIQDPALGGPGGTAKRPDSADNIEDIGYLRAALTQEFIHANFFRDLLSGPQAVWSADPFLTFYFPDGTFDTLPAFLAILNALENAFIGAYLTLIQEFANKAILASTGGLTGADAKYSAKQYVLMAKQAASIMGVECEHRVLGRDLGNVNPANNMVYEGVDGLTSIFNGTSSAVVALTPFLTPSTGPAFSLGTAIAGVPNLSVQISDVLISS